MANKFLDKSGLSALLTQLKEIFASSAEVDAAKASTDPLMLSIDYSVLEFDTDEIIPTGIATSPVIGVGQINHMIIAKS
jgi:hypothetical protein